MANTIIKEIFIEKKIIDNNNTLYYIDNCNRRYTPEKIIQIIKKEKEDGSVRINMQQTTTGLLKSKKGALEIMHMNSRTIMVYIEDSNSGYELYEWFLSASFPTIHFIFETTNGNKKIMQNIKECLNQRPWIEEYILIFDNKLEDSIFQGRLLAALQLLKVNNKKVTLYKPISVEEILLSWQTLYRKIGIIPKTVSNNIVGANGKRWFTYSPNSHTYTACGEIIRNLEEFLTQELIDITKGTMYSYNKRNLKDCYICECCNKLYSVDGKNYYIGKKCRYIKAKDKYDDFKNTSLLKLLYKAVGKYTSNNDYVYSIG